MPIKYIQGARIKYPDWAEPDDPEISALMNQAVNEAKAMIQTEMLAEPDMALDPATGQGMPSRTLKKEKPNYYKINISGGKQYIDITARPQAEQVAGVDPALEQRMARMPVLAFKMYDSPTTVGGYYITRSLTFDTLTWWYEYIEEEFYGKGLNMMFISGVNQIDYKGMFGLPPGVEYVPEGLEQHYPWSMWMRMQAVAARIGGWNNVESDYTYDTYDNTTYSPDPDPLPSDHWVQTCMSGRKDGSSIATSECGSCPPGSAHPSLAVDCTGLTHHWADSYTIIECPDEGGGHSGPEHLMGNTLFCVSTCNCGGGGANAMYCCRSGRWETYVDDCFMCILCNISWSAWHELSCDCVDVCEATWWKHREQGATGSDWWWMIDDADNYLREIISTSGGRSSIWHVDVADLCWYQDCSATYSASSAYPYPEVVYGGMSIMKERHQTARGEPWEPYERWMALYKVIDQNYSLSYSECFDEYACCIACPEPPPPAEETPYPMRVMIVFDNGEPGGDKGEEVLLETITSWNDVYPVTMTIYDCLSEPLYLFSYWVEDCDNVQNYFRYGIYYKGELTLSEPFPNTQECYTDYACDIGESCYAHDIEGAYRDQHGYAKGDFYALFWDYYIWHRFTYDPGAAFPVNPKVLLLPGGGDSG